MVFGRTSPLQGGVYGVTRGLMRKPGSARVFHTRLEQQTDLRLGLSAGITGLLPIPEIR